MLSYTMLFMGELSGSRNPNDSWLISELRTRLDRVLYLEGAVCTPAGGAFAPQVAPACRAHL